MNRNLLTAFIGITILVFVGYAFVQTSSRESVPGENKCRLANKYLEDGKLNAALDTFDRSILVNSSYEAAYLGKAITLMQMGRLDESEAEFKRAIELKDDFAEAYVNRGILYDRTGRFEEAVSDYRKAAELKPELAEGPGMVWRFLHLADNKPANISDRADYVEAELQKPESERILIVPEIDDQQRMYKK